jgi:hypothetical protein
MTWQTKRLDLLLCGTQFAAVQQTVEQTMQKMRHFSSAMER